MANITIDDIVLTTPHLEEKDPDNRVTLDFLAGETDGNIRINIHSERGYGAHVIIQQDEKGVTVIVGNDERQETVVPVLTWDDQAEPEAAEGD